MKKCELCSSIARVYCESDEASLCWDCDARVHAANFLVAKHSRILLCNSCQSVTPWTGSGSNLGPTVSVCQACFNTNSNDVLTQTEDEDDDDDGSSDDGDNQVVPLAFSTSDQTRPPPLPSTSSSSEESSSRFYRRRVDASNSTTVNRADHEFLESHFRRVSRPEEEVKIRYGTWR